MIEVTVAINSTIERVWDAWINPEHIVKWNFASPDWCCPKASVDLKIGGKFSYTMAAKDGSHAFDFSGTFKTLEKFNRIEIALDDDRQLEVEFEALEAGVRVTERFEAEEINDIDLQRFGWQAILNEFKAYVEREIQ